jgi:hypothetical protein
LLGGSGDDGIGTLNAENGKTEKLKTENGKRKTENGMGRRAVGKRPDDRGVIWN